MHIQNLLTATNVWQRHIHLAVKTTRAQQGSIKNVRPIGSGNHNHTHVGFKTVHLYQHLVERLFTLVITATETRPTLTADCVDFINENNAGSILLRIVKHVTDARGADTNKHFDKV